MTEETKPVKAVQMVSVTYQAPKELHDVSFAIVELLADIRAGKDLATLASENLGNLMEAVSGVNELPDDFKAELRASLETTGHLGGQIAGVLLAPAVPTA